MKNYYLKNNLECNQFLSGTYKEIFPDELIFLNKDDEVSMDLYLDVYKKVAAQTSNPILKIVPEDFFFVTHFLSEAISLCLKVHTLIIPDIDFRGINSLEIYPTVHNIEEMFELFHGQTSPLNHVKRVLIHPEHLNLESDAELLTNLLSKLKRLNVYFSRTHPDADEWEFVTNNHAKGPSRVDIDISNSCSHNCIFCGLYNDNSVELMKKNAVNNKSILDIYNQNISKEKFYSILNQLPDHIDYVTLGGAGEPFSHPHILDFIKSLRKRNINITLFTHFSILNERIIDELTLLAEYDNYKSLNFIVNISGTTAETYLRTRPNQTEKSFNRVLELIKYTTDQFELHKKGICLTLMCVTNNQNFHEMPAFIGLTKKLNAKFLWIKPVEICGEEMKSCLVPSSADIEYARLAKLTLHFSKLFKVAIADEHLLQLIVSKFEHELSKIEEKESFSSQIKKALLEYNLLDPMLNNTQLNDIKEAPAVFNKKNPVLDEGQYVEHILKPTNNFQITLGFEYDDSQIIQNTGYTLKYFDKSPCLIAKDYIRFKTTEDVVPCCIYPHKFETPQTFSFEETWFSKSMNDFRKETSEFTSRKHHRQNPTYEFCHQCPHMDIQQKLNIKETT
jgi:wyosine [tRNA(Phe)-imidazoG37] synthetase (radical SAM superfamily)